MTLTKSIITETISEKPDLHPTKAKETVEELLEIMKLKEDMRNECQKTSPKRF